MSLFKQKRIRVNVALGKSRGVAALHEEKEFQRFLQM